MKSVVDLSGKRLLLVKQSSLGDVIHTLPLVHALKRKFSTVRIGWVVERGFAALLDRDGAVDEVHPIHIPSTSDPLADRWAYGRAFAATVKTLYRLRRQFRQAPYDVVLDLHASLRSGFLALANPGGVRIGFADAKEGNTWFQHRLVANASGCVHAIDKNLLFCALFDCEVAEEDFHLCSSPEDRDGVEQFLANSGIGTDERLIYVNPTARWQSKHWLVPRWGALCDRFLAAGLRPVFGGSRDDVSYIGEIAKAMTRPAVVAAGRLSLTESVALMQRASVYVGLDTGPMHMAAMIGTPVVALFGPTHPERVGPYGVAHVVVRADGLDCLCCRKRTCAELRCMHGIEMERVFAATMGLLQGQ